MNAPLRDPRTVYSLGVQEAAAYLGITERALYRLVAREAIDHRRDSASVCVRRVRGTAQRCRFTGRVRFSQAGLDAWEEARRVRPKSERATPGTMTPRSVISEIVLPRERAFR